MVIHTISLCAGVGMLDEGLRLGFEQLGLSKRVIGYVERETFAASQLVALMEAGCLDAAPVWSDLTTFDSATWRGKVDCVIAGFPCQPHSVAGKREGLKDERWIWPDINRIICESGAWLVYLENVPGLATTGGLAARLADLAEAGFDAEWGTLSAAAVGASHKRDRLFILAYRKGRGFRELRQSSGRNGVADGQGQDVEHANSNGRPTNKIVGSAGAAVCDDAQGSVKRSDVARTGGDDELAHPKSQRCGEARRCSERPEERTLSASDVANTESRGRGIRLGDEQPRRAEVKSASADVGNTQDVDGRRELETRGPRSGWRGLARNGDDMADSMRERGQLPIAGQQPAEQVTRASNASMVNTNSSYLQGGGGV